MRAGTFRAFGDDLVWVSSASGQEMCGNAQETTKVQGGKKLPVCRRPEGPEPPEPGEFGPVHQEIKEKKPEIVMQRGYAAMLRCYATLLCYGMLLAYSHPVTAARLTSGPTPPRPATVPGRVHVVACA